MIRLEEYIAVDGIGNLKGIVKIYEHPFPPLDSPPYPLTRSPRVYTYEEGEYYPDEGAYVGSTFSEVIE